MQCLISRLRWLVVKPRTLICNLSLIGLNQTFLFKSHFFFISHFFLYITLFSFKPHIFQTLFSVLPVHSSAREEEKTFTFVFWLIQPFSLFGLHWFKRVHFLLVLIQACSLFCFVFKYFSLFGLPLHWFKLS